MDYPTIPIHHHIETHAVRQPGAIAVVFGTQQLSYQALNQRANQLAHYLVKIGIGAEARVAVCLRPSLDVAVSLLAILKAGGVYVPIDPADPVERLATILADCQPAVVLTETLLLNRLPVSAAPPFFCLDRDWESIQSFPSHNPALAIDPEQTAYLVYTSGTTGKPKGVMASHRNLLQYILSARDRYGFNQQDIMPAIARFTFSISLLELCSPLVAGGRLLLLERHQILTFPRMVQVLEQVTVIHASPSWWRRLLAYILTNNLEGREFPHLRHVSSGGETVPGDLLESLKRLFCNAEIFVIYGCTEISCMGCTYPALRDRKITKAVLGKPFANVEVRVLDPQQQPVANGNEGEIYFAGPGVTKGYLNLPELTQERFVSIEGRRFYRTGDLGRFDQGDLEILGRVDFQIQLRGIRIEPGEIETHLRQAPGVLDGVVVARKLGNSENSLVAYIVLERPEKQDIEPIRWSLKARLPDYMLPAAFVVLDALPVNLNQKLDRRALPAPGSENLARLKAIVPPRDEWERQLVEIWENTLGLRPIGIHNSFFELGGDSLQAVQIVMQIEERWNRTLPITILLEANSIEALAGIIREENEIAEDLFRDVVLLRKGGNKPPLFCLQGVWRYQSMAQHVNTDQPVYGVFLQAEVELIKTRQYDPINSVFSSISRIASRYLRSIRSAQPHGPYRLAGFSFAGLIAFEMAHQLQAAGEEVALIALFDSMMIRKVPLHRRLQCHWNLFREEGFTYLLNKTRLRIERLFGDATRPTIIQNAPTRSPAGDTSSFNAQAQEDMLDEVSALAARSYVPRPYSGRVVLFRATDQTFFSQDVPDLGWQAFAPNLEICNIPGNHTGILENPSVSTLVQRLQTRLD